MKKHEYFLLAGMLLASALRKKGRLRSLEPVLTKNKYPRYRSGSRKNKRKRGKKRRFRAYRRRRR